MAQARAFTTALRAARSFRRGAGTLELLAANRAAVVTFQAQASALAGTCWSVVNINNGRQAVVGMVSGSTVTMAFDTAGRVSGTTGCNRYTAAYRADRITPDNGEKFLIDLENATLTNIQGFLADKPDLTLSLNRSGLEQTMMVAKTLEAQIKDGTAKVSGDAGSLKQFPSTRIDFDPRLNIMPDTKAFTAKLARVDAYQVEVGRPAPE